MSRSVFIGFSFLRTGVFILLRGNSVVVNDRYHCTEVKYRHVKFGMVRKMSVGVCRRIKEFYFILCHFYSFVIDLSYMIKRK